MPGRTLNLTAVRKVNTVFSSLFLLLGKLRHIDVMVSITSNHTKFEGDQTYQTKSDHSERDAQN